ncbi:hypothetical protein Bbelb_161900 [Branchiostoma belcheri]|nr:hypothetical protein Bbelb_161900 [Branchiostoma belcheri]
MHDQKPLSDRISGVRLADDRPSVTTKSGTSRAGILGVSDARANRLLAIIDLITSSKYSGDTRRSSFIRRKAGVANRGTPCRLLEQAAGQSPVARAARQGRRSTRPPGGRNVAQAQRAMTDSLSFGLLVRLFDMPMLSATVIPVAWMSDYFQGLHRPAPRLHGLHAPKEIYHSPLH